MHVMGGMVLLFTCTIDINHIHSYRVNYRTPMPVITQTLYQRTKITRMTTTMNPVMMMTTAIATSTLNQLKASWSSLFVRGTLHPPTCQIIPIGACEPRLIRRRNTYWIVFWLTTR